jgi:hypothetical protein
MYYWLFISPQQPAIWFHGNDWAFVKFCPRCGAGNVRRVNQKCINCGYEGDDFTPGRARARRKPRGWKFWKQDEYITEIRVDA